MSKNYMILVFLVLSACSSISREPAGIHNVHTSDKYRNRVNSDGSIFFYDRTNPAPRTTGTIAADLVDQLDENFNFDPLDYITTVARGSIDNYVSNQSNGLSPHAGRFGSELIRTPINNAIGRFLKP